MDIARYSLVRLYNQNQLVKRVATANESSRVLEVQMSVDQSSSRSYERISQIHNQGVIPTSCIITSLTWTMIRAMLAGDSLPPLMPKSLARKVFEQILLHSMIVTTNYANG